ncbi:hypothetical protein NM208_g3375 [Fusarium decemcellulare]|uniref:Uncharacterized protein n=1 Tax=Fusarium decemcellulare TaxID=57161 RepID=A0ACC1SPF0_9HYPO|nr:hypothetical protein NM208_g3375 [Fusarium decemcellulare]
MRVSFITFLLTSLLIVTLGLAAKVGLFDSEGCVDPSGMEKCYELTSNEALGCYDIKKCDEQDEDGESGCALSCRCLQNHAEINCASTHCWNKVYSCEYQQTVEELASHCSKPDLEAIPFYPPPNNAPAACSCNLGQLAVTMRRLIDETDSCINNIGSLSARDLDDLGDVWETCQCCSISGILSLYWNICPDMNPSVLGADDWYNVHPQNNFPACGKYMDAMSCIGDLGFAPPGLDKSAKFFAPGEFPENGTQTTVSNLGGSITSPLSGETFSWTLGGIAHTVTVASADAKPTGSAGGKEGGDGKEDSDNASQDDEEDAASLLSPGLWLIALTCVVIV